MNRDVVQSLVEGGDEDFREIALPRLLRARHLSDEETRLLRESIPTLPHGQMIDLLAVHGDLGEAAVIVDRLVAEMPRDHREQWFYLSRVLDTLSSALDDDAYADFVERALPYVSDELQPALLRYLRGSPLFNAIVAKDAAWTGTADRVVAKPVTVMLLDVRYGERGIRTRLELRIAGADVGELLRLSGVLAVDCADLARTAWSRSLERFAFSTEHDANEHESAVRRHHTQLVLDWVMEPAPDRADRLAWFADRVTELERGGEFVFDMFRAESVFPKGLPDEIARILVDRGEAPDWAGPHLVERLATRSFDVWPAVFAWWSRRGHTFHSARFHESYRVRKAIITEAPLPDAAPDAFDEDFLRCGEDLIALEQDQIRMRMQVPWCKRPFELPADMSELERRLELHPELSYETAQYRPLVTVPKLVERLLDMSLTPAQAARLVLKLKDYPELIRHPRMAEVAALAGPIEADALPACDAIELHDVKQIQAYRQLGGATAEGHLREHLRRSFAELKTEPEHAYLSAGMVSWWWPWVAEVIDDELRTEIQSWVCGRRLTAVVDLHRSAPWLVDERVLATAAEKYLDAGHRWDMLDVPPVLRPFVEERARRTDDDKELLRILAWLEEHGAPRSVRLDLLLARLERRPPTEALAEMARMFMTRTAWENEGPRLLRAFVRWGDWVALNRLWTVLMLAAHYPPREKGTATLLTAVHLAFAIVLLELADAAAAAGDDARLGTVLTAVLQLDPPPPIVRKLATLKDHADLSDRARKRIDTGMMLFKSTEGRTPTFSGLTEATATMWTEAEKARSAAQPVSST